MATKHMPPCVYLPVVRDKERPPMGQHRKPDRRDKDHNTDVDFPSLAVMTA